MRKLTALFALVALVAGCSPAPAPSGSPTRVVESGSGLTLAVTGERSVVAAGEEIAVQASLSHDQPGPVTISGSGSGIVFFSVTRLHDGLSSGPPAMQGDCVPHELPAGEPTEYPFGKSGGWSPDDPNAEFMELYHSDPALTLPPGAWRIDVTALGTLGAGCLGEALDLATSIEISVTE